MVVTRKAFHFCCRHGVVWKDSFPFELANRLIIANTSLYKFYQYIVIKNEYACSRHIKMKESKHDTVLITNALMVILLVIKTVLCFFFIQFLFFLFLHNYIYIYIHIYIYIYIYVCITHMKVYISVH